ncbi:MAG TPA: hypothetical protein VGF79_02500 [Bacteroidia bacterium]
MENQSRSNLQYVLETAHIPLWLLKDICWLMEYRTAGMIIAVPTILVAFWVAFITRKDKKMFLPNVSIAFWIVANANWMTAEFYNLNTKPLSIYPFLAGVLVFVIFCLQQLKARTTKKL